MKIYLTPSTIGRYGGGLNENLRHLNCFIQTELNNSGFKSSFDELWLTLAYPPLYVLPGVIAMVADFKIFYDNLPSSRLNRRYKKIEVSLQAPELSEHFDKAEQNKYEHQFDIEDKFKNINETDLAKILVDKYLQAGELIFSKLKKEDSFDFAKFKSIFLTIRQNINPDFLNSINSKQSIQVQDDTINKAIELREKRKQTNRVNDKGIRDLRVYYVGLPERALYPYANQYSEIFLNLLQKNGLMCPVYHHLYIQVAKTFEDGLKNSFAYEDFYVNGISVIDYDHYEKSNDSEKAEIAFNLIVQGLKDIAEIDRLNYSIIEKTIEEIKKDGLATELIFQVIENKNHILTVSYFAKSIEEENPIFFTLFDKQTNKSKKIQIGRANHLQIHMWLQKITLTNKQIKVKSSNSVRAEVYLKDKPKTMEFEMIELLT